MGFSAAAALLSFVPVLLIFVLMCVCCCACLGRDFVQLQVEGGMLTTQFPPVPRGNDDDDEEQERRRLDQG